LLNYTVDILVIGDIRIRDLDQTPKCMGLGRDKINGYNYSGLMLPNMRNDFLLFTL